MTEYELALDIVRAHLLNRVTFLADSQNTPLPETTLDRCVKQTEVVSAVVYNIKADSSFFSMFCSGDIEEITDSVLGGKDGIEVIDQGLVDLFLRIGMETYNKMVAEIKTMVNLIKGDDIKNQLGASFLDDCFANKRCIYCLLILFADLNPEEIGNGNPKSIG